MDEAMTSMNEDPPRMGCIIHLSSRRIFVFLRRINADLHSPPIYLHNGHTHLDTCKVNTNQIFTTNLCNDYHQPSKTLMASIVTASVPPRIELLTEGLQTFFANLLLWFADQTLFDAH